mgnify:FL=1
MRNSEEIRGTSFQVIICTPHFAMFVIKEMLSSSKMKAYSMETFGEHHCSKGFVWHQLMLKKPKPSHIVGLLSLSLLYIVWSWLKINFSLLSRRHYFPEQNCMKCYDTTQLFFFHKEYFVIIYSTKKSIFTRVLSNITTLCWFQLSPLGAYISDMLY